MNSWSRIVEEMRPRFVERSLERLARMRGLLDQLPQAEAGLERRLLEELTGHFHDLKGTGQAYRFEGVSRVAGGAEAECWMNLEENRPPRPIQLERWGRCLEQIRGELMGPPQAGGQAME